ncbi:MAG: selenocysteine synthase [Alphaproteobacteria bacterium]
MTDNPSATVFDAWGVAPIINAAGPKTRLSGAIMAPQVVAAMAEAAALSVDMADLQAAASAVIARATGAEAGLVTAGASAALLLGTAACIARLDPAAMNRLPDTRGLARQVLVAKGQRNFYDHAVRATGARLVEIGLPDRFAGAGMRDAEAWEYDRAIGPGTAAILYVARPGALPRLDEVVAVGRARNVPVLVDAAGQLPPAENLRAFTHAGADLVAFSGGKAIGGPQASGILAGRRDLIASASLQMLDQDERFDLWQPAPGPVRKGEIVGLPQHGIGRSAKVGKEQIAGLLTALDLFTGTDGGDHMAARRARWHQETDALMAALAAASGAPAGAATGVAVHGYDKGGVPMVELRLGAGARLSADALYVRLQEGRPSIRANGEVAHEGVLRFGPLCLRPGEGRLVGERVAALLGGANL